MIHQTVNDQRNRSKEISDKNDKLISELEDEGIEILNSQLDGHTVVVWIWCHSQAALENIQNMYESHQLRDFFLNLANIRIHSSKIIKSNVINIDKSQFMKTFGKFICFNNMQIVP